MKENIKELKSKMKTQKVLHEQKLEQSIIDWKQKVKSLTELLIKIQTIATEEHKVNSVIRSKLENLVYKYRSDIKELKKIIVTPRLHEKYIQAVKQRQTLTERGMPIPQELDIDIYVLAHTGTTPRTQPMTDLMSA